MKSIWKYNIFFLGEGVVVFHLQVKYTVCKMIIHKPRDHCAGISRFVDYCFGYIFLLTSQIAAYIFHKWLTFCQNGCNWCKESLLLSPGNKKLDFKVTVKIKDSIVGCFKEKWNIFFHHDVCTTMYIIHELPSDSTRKARLWCAQYYHARNKDGA